MKLAELTVTITDTSSLWLLWSCEDSWVEGLTFPTVSTDTAVSPSPECTWPSL